MDKQSAKDPFVPKNKLHKNNDRIEQQDRSSRRGKQQPQSE